MELQKPRQTLRLQQLILDQIQTDHQTHTGLRLENRQWGIGRASTAIMLPIPYTKIKFITLATSSMINPTQGDISTAYEDTTLDKVQFQIRWYGLAANYIGAWLTLGI